jgi:hypothetical protein
VGVFEISCACARSSSRRPCIHVASNTRGRRLLVVSYTYTHMRARAYKHTHTSACTHANKGMQSGICQSQTPNRCLQA